MRLPRTGKRKINWRRLATRGGVVIAIVALYVAYWALTPTSLTVLSFSPSQNDNTVLVLTLHNPSVKFISGELLSIETGQGVPGPHGASELLGSIPKVYDFVVAPYQSVTLTVPMDYVMVPAYYMINLHFDGLGSQQIVFAYGNIPSSP